MREDIKINWKERVKNNDYTDGEWNRHLLCRFVSYKGVPLSTTKQHETN